MGISTSDFKEKLEEQHAFPTVYMFKFIVPVDKESEVLNLLPQGEISSKASKNGNYISITAKLLMLTSDQVIKIYQKAHLVKGLIAL